MFIGPRETFDKAFVGWGRRAGDEAVITVYDWALLLEAVMIWLDCEADYAAAYIETNIEGSWAGDATPLIVQRGTPADLEELL